MSEDFKMAHAIRPMMVELEAEYDKFMEFNKDGVFKYYKELPDWIRVIICNMTNIDIYYRAGDIGIKTYADYNAFIRYITPYYCGQGYKITIGNKWENTPAEDVRIMIEIEQETLDMIKTVEAHRSYKMLKMLTAAY